MRGTTTIADRKEPAISDITPERVRLSAEQRAQPRDPPITPDQPPPTPILPEPNPDPTQDPPGAPVLLIGDPPPGLNDAPRVQ